MLALRAKVVIYTLGELLQMIVRGQSEQTKKGIDAFVVKALYYCVVKPYCPQ